MGRLDKALEEARQRGWLVVDMQADWQRVFAFECCSPRPRIVSGAWVPLAVSRAD